MSISLSLALLSFSLSPSNQSGKKYSKGWAVTSPHALKQRSSRKWEFFSPFLRSIISFLVFRRGLIHREDENRIKFVFPIALSARLRRVAGGVVKELDIKRVNQYYIADHWNISSFQISRWIASQDWRSRWAILFKHHHHRGWYLQLWRGGWIKSHCYSISFFGLEW